MGSYQNVTTWPLQIHEFWIPDSRTGVPVEVTTDTHDTPTCTTDMGSQIWGGNILYKQVISTAKYGSTKVNASLGSMT